jgi:hypothetical protein
MLSRLSSTILLTGLMTLAGTGCKKQQSNTTRTSDAGMASPVSISSVELGRRLGSDQRISDATDKFGSRDTIYASVLTNGTAPNATVTARWTYQDQQIVKEDSRTIAPNGTEATEFHISKPSGWPKGKYKFTASVGGSTQSKDFEVK